jgi:drug/metabolite transporter (DMT)-like permease
MASNHILKGMSSMLAAVASFSVMDAGMKHLTDAYSPLQITFLRGAASLPFIFVAITLSRRWKDVRTGRPGMHLLRGLLNVIMLIAFIYSVKLLSLVDAYSIFLCAPLLITALSVPMLGERVHWTQWIAIIAGMTGVLVMLRPSAQSVITLGGIAALFAAVCYALSAIMITKLTRTETTYSTMLWTLTIVTCVSGVFAVTSWTPIAHAHWLWIATIGLTGALGQLFIITAFRLAPASSNAPFEYTALLWGLLFDWWLWKTLPDVRMLGGASLIVASGLYLIYRERRRDIAIATI